MNISFVLFTRKPVVEAPAPQPVVERTPVKEEVPLIDDDDDDSSAYELPPFLRNRNY